MQPDGFLNDLISIGTGDGLVLPSTLTVSSLDMNGTITESPAIAPVLRVRDVPSFSTELANFSGIPGVQISAIPLSNGLSLVTIWPGDLTSLDPLYLMHEAKSFTFNPDAPSITLNLVSSLDGIGWSFAKEYSSGKVLLIGIERLTSLDYSGTLRQNKTKILTVDFNASGVVTELENSLSQYVVTEEDPDITYNTAATTYIIGISSNGAIIQSDYVSSYYNGGGPGSYYPTAYKTRLHYVNFTTNSISTLSSDMYESDPVSPSTTSLNLLKQVGDFVVFNYNVFPESGDPGKEKLSLVNLATGTLTLLDTHLRPYASIVNPNNDQQIAGLIKLDLNSSDLFLLKHIKNTADNFAKWDLKKVDMTTGVLSNVKSNIAPIASNYSNLLSGPIFNSTRTKSVFTFGSGGHGDQILVKSDGTSAGTSLLYTVGPNEYIYAFTKISNEDRIISMIQDNAYPRIPYDVMSMEYSSGSFIRLIRGGSIDDTTSSYNNVATIGHPNISQSIITFATDINPNQRVYWGSENNNSSFGPAVGTNGFSQSQNLGTYADTIGTRWFVYGTWDTTPIEDPLTKASKNYIVDLANGQARDLPATGSVTGDSPIGQALSNYWEAYPINNSITDIDGSNKYHMFLYHSTSYNDLLQFWFSSFQ